MNHNILDEDWILEELNMRLAEGLVWWEEKRLWFNIIVGITGLIPTLFSIEPYLFKEIITGSILWVILVNLCFSLGYLAEALDQHYCRGRFQLDKLRWLVLILGTYLTYVVAYFFSKYYITWII